MDTSHCPDGAFTDNILMFTSSIIANNADNNNNNGVLGAGQCDSPTAGYQTFLIVISLFRICLGILQFRLWFRRVQVSNDSTRRTSLLMGFKARRIPFIPCLSLLAGCFELLFFLLTALNVVNDKNSFSVTLIGLFYVPVMFAHVIYMHKVIRLGRRIIPKASVLIDLSQERATRLAAYDHVLLILLVLFGSMLVGICVTLVVAPLYPGNPLPFQVMSAFVGCYQVSAALTVIWQLHRCRSVIAISEKALAGKVDRSSPQRVAVRYATMKMKQQQLICLMVALCGGLLNTLIAARIILVSWYLVGIILFGFENLFEAVSVWNMTRRMPRPSQNTETNAKFVIGNTNTRQSVTKYAQVAESTQQLTTHVG
jgi:hypothetical protein